MARPVRCRRIEQLPVYRSFAPDEKGTGERVQLTLDEFETVRLLDAEGLTQEECASRMNIARTTVTAIYDSARKKLADMLVYGKRLEISGGCCRFEPAQGEFTTIEKGNNIMRIAVTYEAGQIFQHFGHTEQFKLYDVEDGKIVGEQIVDTNGSGHGALAGFLHAAKVDALICGGIGMGARMALADAGIQLYPGVQGDADAAAKALAEGSLNYDPDAHCDHHEHHGEGGNCGGHEHGGECGGHGHGGECGHGNCGNH